MDKPFEQFPVLNLSDLIDRYEGFLLDAYGVFWGSAEVGMLPDAKETMKLLMKKDKKVGILSNSTQLAHKEKQKLAKHGLQEGTHYHFLLTSGEVARQFFFTETLPFQTPRKTYWLFGADHPRISTHPALFEGTNYRQSMNIEEADFIYIPIPHLEGIDQENSEVFFPMVQEASKQGIPVLCANPDRFAPEGLPPRLVVRQGTIAQMFEDQGIPVFFIGKPYPGVYEQALCNFPKGLPRSQILMIGDTPETDIRGARQLGIATALVTQTGVMAERIKDQIPSNAIKGLPLSDQPDFAIKAFRVESCYTAPA